MEFLPSDFSDILMDVFSLPVLRGNLWILTICLLSCENNVPLFVGRLNKNTLYNQNSELMISQYLQIKEESIISVRLTQKRQTPMSLFREEWRILLKEEENYKMEKDQRGLMFIPWKDVSCKDS